jgi:hypothetical protein
LNFLSLCGTKIDSIPKNAFNFEKESKETLRLDLQLTKLNGTGFQLGSLENLKRPTDIYLGDNPKLTYLDEQIFRPFLEANDQNVIRIDTFHVLYFDCKDCRSYWLKKGSKYYNRTNLWICSNGYKSLYDNTSFAQCEHFL